jgi:hypothetical protein
MTNCHVASTCSPRSTAVLQQQKHTSTSTARLANTVATHSDSIVLVAFIIVNTARTVSTRGGSASSTQTCSAALPAQLGRRGAAERQLHAHGVAGCPVRSAAAVAEAVAGRFGPTHARVHLAVHVHLTRHLAVHVHLRRHGARPERERRQQAWRLRRQQAELLGQLWPLGAAGDDALPHAGACVYTAQVSTSQQKSQTVS